MHYISGIFRPLQIDHVCEISARMVIFVPTMHQVAAAAMLSKPWEHVPGQVIDHVARIHIRYSAVISHALTAKYDYGASDAS